METVLTAQEFYNLPTRPTAWLRDGRRITGIYPNAQGTEFSATIMDVFGDDEVSVTNRDIVVDGPEYEEAMLARPASSVSKIKELRERE